MMKTQHAISAGQRARNRIVIFLHRIGLPVGPTYLLTVPGRTSGLPRTTPVAPVVIDGTMYLSQAYPRPQWVKNVQAAGHGVLTRGRTKHAVDLTEVPEEQRGPILREIPSQVPMGVSTYLRNGLADSRSPEGFASAAARCLIFRVTQIDHHQAGE